VYRGTLARAYFSKAEGIAVSFKSGPAIRHRRPDIIRNPGRLFAIAQDKRYSSNSPVERLRQIKGGGA